MWILHTRDQSFSCFERQVYRKPANFKRDRDPSLLSIKPFYLHLSLSIETINE